MKRRIASRVVFFIALIAAYLLVIFIIPPDASVLTKYDLRPSQYVLIRLAVLTPLIAIWLIALYGFVTVYRYAGSIRKHKDGKAFVTLSSGLGVLAFGLPLQSLMSSLLNYASRTNPAATPATTIINNYLALAIVLIGFYIINKGAKALLTNTKTDEPNSIHYQAWQFGLAVFSAIFVYLTLTNPARSVPIEGAAKAVYYLPDWLIVLTIIIPYIAVWYLGMQSAYYIRHYRNKVPGMLYKQALGFLANGIGAVILASMLLRLLTNMTAFFKSAELKILLAVVYLLLVAISIGYILIAKGANKLRKMEEA